MGLPALLQFESHEIRLIDRDGESWWLLADVCRALELSDPSMTASRLDPDEKGTSTIGTQEMLIVSEPGLYKLISTSRKPVAKRFDRWVRHEVLPQIRKTGSYGSQVPEVAQQIITGLKEALAPLAIRFDGQDRAIERIENRQDAMAEDVDWIKKKLAHTRQRLKDSTKDEHVDAVDQLGGRCPCGCGREIVKNGEKLSVAQFDHFYANYQPDVDHTWLIHTICHSEFTRGLPRYEREAAFRAYQEARRRLPGRQKKLPW